MSRFINNKAIFNEKNTLYKYTGINEDSYMGLKVINPLIKAVAQKAYVTPKMEVRTLESLGLKMEQLSGDIITISKKSITKYAIEQMTQNYLSLYN